MKIRNLVLLAAAGAVYLAQTRLHSQSGITAAQPDSPSTMSFRIVFGVGDTAPARWDGSAQVPGARNVTVEGWRFGDQDRADRSGASWKLASEASAAGTEERFGPIAPKGVLLSAESVTPQTQFNVRTANGDFSFTPPRVTFASNLVALRGRVRVERVPNTYEVTRASADHDSPALASSGDNLYLAYIDFSHSNRTLEDFATMKQAPRNFDWLARPAGGDQVKLMRYSKSQRQWSEPENVSPVHEDCMRAAVAVDGRGRVWVIWSANRGGNFDLYARYQDRGSWSKEIRITNDPGTDVNPVAASDSAGHVWVAWQAYRAGSLDVMAAVQEGNQFTKAERVSFSSASDWDPAIATGPHGEIAVTWDTYDKGDYDVYARVMRFEKGVKMESPFAVAASANFEARSSAAYDRQGRLWVAFEASGEKWGKDFGAYEHGALSLYRGHTLRVKCFQGGAAFEPAGSLEEVLRSVPGLTGREGPPSLKILNPGMGYTTVQGPRNSLPRIAADGEGRIFLTFRSGAGLRSQIGSIFHQFLTFYADSRWARPVEIPRTEGPVDMRPALASAGAGDLLLIALTDRRASFTGRMSEEANLAGGENLDRTLMAAEFRVDAAAKEPALTPIPAETPAAPSADSLSERSAIATLRGARSTIGAEHYQLMRGEFHRHTELSLDGGADGPLIDAYRYLIDAAGMDWAGCCDHDNGGGREFFWWQEQKLTDAYHLGASFVPMFSYERSVAYPEGHRNAIFEQRGVRPLPRLPKTAVDSSPSPAPDTQMLYSYLRQFHGIVASHTSTTGMGTDWRDNDPILEPIVEIYQGERQNYEMPGAPRAATKDHNIAGFFPLGFVSLALKRGYRLGFEASSDHISTHISYCNLWVKNPTREGVMEAFRKRRIYGATDNILAEVRCGDHFMGEEFSASDPVIRVHLAGTAPFASVRIIRDGAVVYTAEPKTREVAFDWRDAAPPPKGGVSYYYVRGEQADGELVWASPMWIHLQ